MRNTGLWFAITIAASACGGQEIGPLGGAGFETLPADQVIAGFEQYATENGLNKAIMRGDTAYIFEDSSVAHVKTVNLVLYDEAGTVNARVTARTGRLNTFTQAMTATGNVVLVTEKDGRRIETDELNYDPTTHRVWSTVRTVQRYQGSTFTGTGFEADDKFENVRVIGARTTGGGLRITF